MVFIYDETAQYWDFKRELISSKYENAALKPKMGIFDFRLHDRKHNTFKFQSVYLESQKLVRLVRNQFSNTVHYALFDFLSLRCKLPVFSSH